MNASRTLRAQQAAMTALSLASEPWCARESLRPAIDAAVAAALESGSSEVEVAGFAPAIRPTGLSAPAAPTESARGDAQAMRQLNESAAVPLWTNQSGIAVFNLFGVIRRADAQVKSYYGERIGTSQTMIMRFLAEADADPNIRGKLIVTDSPGGVANGMQPVAAAVRHSNTVKPVWAYVSGGAYSAAYYAISQCAHIALGRDDAVGSIGTYTVLYDFTKMLRDMGIEANLISSGGVKGQGVMGTPVTPELRSHVQEVISSIQDLFNQAVALGRGMSLERVAQIATGREWLAEAALKEGLVDSVRSYGEVLTDLAQRTAAPAANGRLA